MNTHSFSPTRNDGRRALHPLAFEADWKSMVLIHFAIDPEHLAPHVPLPLDLFEGKAYLSLVYFSFEAFRPAGSGAWGRWLGRPLSDHPFLNLRTYVRGSAGPGILFIAEWITRRLSHWIGPMTHGLPYRLGTFCVENDRPGGIASLVLTDDGGGGDLRLSYPSRRDKPQSAVDCSLDAFLLERYVAYTERKGVTRAFEVRHKPWTFDRPDWVRADTPLLTQTFSWFAHAQIVGGHTSEGFENVYMGPPRVVRKAGSINGLAGDRAFANSPEPAAVGGYSTKVSE